MKASVATTAGLSAQRSLLKAVEELVMNMLAELTTTNITKEAFEEQTGKRVVTSLNMKQYLDAQHPTLGLNQDTED